MVRVFEISIWSAVAILLRLGSVSAVEAQESSTPLVIVLTETDTVHDGLPVYTRHAEADSVVAGLSRGLSGLMLRVYRMEQNYLEARDGVIPEPLYVLLSNSQGGYAREGFVLDDEVKPRAGYVDVHRDWAISGRFGAMDQIVPHELAHVIRRQLVGELRDGGTNQVHSLGLRTDRVVAFNEGFAEHLQAVAIDRSPDVPALVKLSGDLDRLERVYDRFSAYERELSARFSPAGRMRMGFIAWYSNDEDVLRYHAVKNNVFLHEPRLPTHLLATDPYRAYLLDGILPGTDEGPVKSLGRLASSEAVIAAFFYQWAMNEQIGALRLGGDFYARFGVDPSEINDLENTYLKIIDALYESKPQTVFEMIEGYVNLFPEEGPLVDSLMYAVFGGNIRIPSPELWMANRDFTTGTTLFDQYRGLPRTHTFDLNAASTVDLVSIPGVELELAYRILAKGPYETVQDLRRVEGLTEDQSIRFASMRDEMEVLRSELESEDAESISINAILLPVVIRALLVITISAVLGIFVYALLRRRSGLEPVPWYRLVWNGFAIGVVGCTGGWLLGFYGAGAIVLTGVVCGLPAAGYQLLKGERKTALTVLRLWAFAATPSVLLTGSWL